MLNFEKSIHHSFCASDPMFAWVRCEPDVGCMKGQGLDLPVDHLHYSYNGSPRYKAGIDTASARGTENSLSVTCTSI